MAEQKLSTADILAKIRAGKGGAAAPAADAPVAKAAPAAKPAVAVASDAPKLSVEEMLRAVRGESASLTPSATPRVKPDIVIMPQKPPAAKAKKETGKDRR